MLIFGFQFLTAVMAVFTNSFVLVTHMIIDPTPFLFLIESMPLASEIALLTSLYMKVQHTADLYPFVAHSISAVRLHTPDELDNHYPSSGDVFYSKSFLNLLPSPSECPSPSFAFVPEMPDVVAHVAGEDSSTDLVISIPVDASRPIGLRVVILVDIILLLCIYIFVKYLWQIVCYLYSSRALKEIELDCDDALDQELLGSLDYNDKICMNEMLVSTQSDGITNQQDSDEQELLITSERDVLLSIMDNGYPTIETLIHSPLLNPAEILYQEFEVRDYPVAGPAEPTADVVESVEEVAERVQVSKQAQEIADPVRDIVQPIELQVECPPKIIVQAVALTAAAPLVNTTIQPTNEVINSAKLALPIEENTRDVENILQPVPQIPELAESLLLSVETVPNFCDDHLQGTSQFTQETSEISLSGSISMLVWDSDDASTGTKDILQLPSMHPSMTDEIDISVEAVSPIFLSSALPSNDDRCNEAQNPTLEDNSNEAIRLAEDQDIAVVQLDQDLYTIRILTSGVDTNDMAVGDDLSLILDSHPPHMPGPSALPDAASPTPLTEVFDMEPNPLPATEPVGFTPPLPLPNDIAMAAPLPTSHIDDGSVGVAESSVIRKKRRRPTVWERMAKKKAKALLMQAPVVEVPIPVFSMDDDNRRPLTALERMAKRHARQLQVSTAEPPIPVFDVGDEKRAFIKAAVLEANSMISDVVHPSSRGISGFGGPSTNPVPFDENKKARIKAAVLEANMMICGANHPQLIVPTDSDSGKSLSLSNNSNANKEVRVNIARLEANKMTNGHPFDHGCVARIAPTLLPVIPDCSNSTTDNSLAHAKYISSPSQADQDPHLELEAVSSTSTTLKRTVLGVQSDFVADAKALQPVKSMVDLRPPVVTNSIVPAMNAAVVQLPSQLPRNSHKNMKRSPLESDQQRSHIISPTQTTYRSTIPQSHVLQPTNNIHGRRNYVKQQASRYKDNKTIPTSVVRASTVELPPKNLSHLASKLHTPILSSTAHGKHGASTSSFSLTNQRSENLSTDRNFSSSRWTPQNGR